MTRARRSTDDLVQRLSELVEASAEPAAQQRREANALVQEWSETLRGEQESTRDHLTEAAEALRAEGTDLSLGVRALAADLPALLAPVLEQLAAQLREAVVSTMAHARAELVADTARLQAGIEVATEASGARTLEHLGEVRAGVRQLETSLTQRTDALAEEAERLATEADLLSEQARVGTQQLLTQLGEARTVTADLDGAATGAAAQIRQTTADMLEQVDRRWEALEQGVAVQLHEATRTAHGQLTATVNELRDRMREVLDERAHQDELLERRLDARHERLTTRTVQRLAEATAASEQALAAVAEEVASRLAAVLEERDRRDELLEKRLEARVDRLTTKTVTRLGDVAAALDERVTELRARETADREHVATVVRDVVERLLSEPRAGLRTLRRSLRDD